MRFKLTLLEQEHAHVECNTSQGFFQLETIA